jgi:hypothetical protein
MLKYPLILTDLDDWYRGPGRERQFIATDLEVQEWLNNALLPQYAPYYIIGADSEKRPGWPHYKKVPYTCDISQFLICLKSRSFNKRIVFAIASSKLTPDLNLKIGDDVDGKCSYNGLIQLNHGGMRTKLVNPTARKPSDRRSKELYRDTSRIAFNYKMRNAVTGEERVYDEYLEIFEALRKTIKRALRYTSILEDLFGNEGEDTTTNLWTEGAYQAYKEGVLFFHRPGNPIERKKPKKK